MPYLQNEVPHSTYLAIAGGSMRRGDGPRLACGALSLTKCQPPLLLWCDCGPAPAATLPQSDLRYWQTHTLSSL